MAEIIKPFTSIIYKTSVRSKERVGQVRDMKLTKGEIRYAVWVKEEGFFLNGETLHEALNNPEGWRKKDNRFYFFMWMKPCRITKIL